MNFYLYACLALYIITGKEEYEKKELYIELTKERRRPHKFVEDVEIRNNSLIRVNQREENNDKFGRISTHIK